MNDRKQSSLSEHFSLLVLSVRQAVGIYHQNVSYLETEDAGGVSLPHLPQNG